MSDRDLDIKRIQELQKIRAVLSAEEADICEEIRMLTARIGWTSSPHESYLESQRTTAKDTQS